MWLVEFDVHIKFKKMGLSKTDFFEWRAFSLRWLFVTRLNSTGYLLSLNFGMLDAGPEKYACQILTVIFGWINLYEVYELPLDKAF